jgi:hypothetical protein
MTNIIHLHVSAQGCHPQGVFQVQHASLDVQRHHLNDYNMKILKFLKF